MSENTSTHTIKAKYYAGYSRNLMTCGIKYTLSDEEYAKYLKRQFPIRGTIGIEEDYIWLDENDCIHRENNLPAIMNIGNGTGTKMYHIHGIYHRTNGPAYESSVSHNYYLNGKKMEKEEFEKATIQGVYFFAQKIITLQKLLEIPELYDEVYYKRKNEFMTLLRKI